MTCSDLHLCLHILKLCFQNKLTMNSVTGNFSFKLRCLSVVLSVGLSWLVEVHVRLIIAGGCCTVWASSVPCRSEDRCRTPQRAGHTEHNQGLVQGVQTMQAHGTRCQRVGTRCRSKCKLLAGCSTSRRSRWWWSSFRGRSVQACSRPQLRGACRDGGGGGDDRPGHGGQA